MRMHPRPAWRRSSYCNELHNACVEVARTPRRVNVRDSKDTSRPGLSVDPTGWTYFLTHLARV